MLNLIFSRMYKHYGDNYQYSIGKNKPFPKVEEIMFSSHFSHIHKHINPVLALL